MLVLFAFPPGAVLEIKNEIGYFAIVHWVSSVTRTLSRHYEEVAVTESRHLPSSSTACVSV